MRDGRPATLFMLGWNHGVDGRQVARPPCRHRAPDHAAAWPSRKPVRSRMINLILLIKNDLQLTTNKKELSLVQPSGCILSGGSTSFSGPATARISAQCRVDLLILRRGRQAQIRDQLHDLAGLAASGLGHLMRNARHLHRVRVIPDSQPLGAGYPPVKVADGKLAGAHRDAIHIGRCCSHDSCQSVQAGRGAPKKKRHLRRGVHLVFGSVRTTVARIRKPMARFRKAELMC